MKYLKFLLTVLLVFMALACSSSDDGGMTTDPDSENPEIETPREPSPLAGTLVLGQSDQTLVLDASTGNNLSTFPQALGNSFLFQNDFVFILNDRISRAEDALGEMNVWDLNYENFMGTNSSISKVVAYDASQLVFVLSLTDPATFATTYRLTAISLASGAELWAINQNDQVYHFGILDDRLITIEGPPGFQAETQLRVRELATGSLLDSELLGERISNLQIAANLAIIQSWNNRVFAVNNSLDTVWEVDTGSPNVFKGVESDGLYIFPSRDNTLYAVDLSTGNSIWTLDLPEFSEPRILNRDNSFLTLITNEENDYRIAKVNKDNGDITNSFLMGRSSGADGMTTLQSYPFLLMSERNDSNTRLQLIDLPLEEVRWSRMLDRGINHAHGLLNNQELIFQSSL